MTLFTDAEFAAVRDYLRTQAGLAFDDSRRPSLAAVVADRLAVTGQPDVATYLAFLGEESGRPERQRLLDSVTVQETSFFRNAPQMEALRRRVLPELLRRSAGRKRPLTIWSAGCSTGEEPYSLAMMLLELSPVLASPGSVRILGTDVSAEALRSAARATYAGRTLDSMPPLAADRWLEPRPGGTFGVRDQVRRLVEFRLHNLVTDPSPFEAGEVDLVVCRNVTIYFDRDTTARLVGGFHDALADDGYLLLGHSETLWQVSDAFTLLPLGDAFIYRRATPLPAVPTPPRPPSRPAASRRAPAARRARPAVGAAPRVPVAQGTPRVPVAQGTPRVPARPGRGQVLLEAARAAAADGRYEVAARAAAEAVAADPLLAPGYLLLGEARTILGEDAAAADALRKAVYLDPALAPAHFLLAGALARLGQPGPASVSYRAAAAALAAAAPGDFAQFLGGRDRHELAALCLRLAAEHEAGRPLAAGGER